MKLLKFDDKLPIYIQIMNFLKKRMVAGEIKGADKLPSVRDLSSKLKVNPNTVQRSYQELEREGLVYTQRGMGTFVIDDESIIKDLRRDMAKEIVEKFLANMRELGFDRKEIVEVVLNEVEKEEDE